MFDLVFRQRGMEKVGMLGEREIIITVTSLLVSFRAAWSLSLLADEGYTSDARLL